MAELKINNAADKSKVPAVSPEQIKYANLLLYGSWTGILILVVTFILYVTGIMPSYIEPSQMQNYWGMKPSEYLAVANAPHGWGWLGMLGYGDFITLLGIAFLGILTIIRRTLPKKIEYTQP